jgi:hypothetical protein
MADLASFLGFVGPDNVWLCTFKLVVLRSAFLSAADCAKSGTQTFFIDRIFGASATV